MQKTFTFVISLIAWIFGGMLTIIFLWNNSDQSITSFSSTQRENQTQTISIQNLENTLTQLAKEVSPSVVSIVIKKDLPTFRRNPFGFFRESGWTIETEIGGGTGFFVDTDWTIITNKHVVRDTTASYSVVLNNWEVFDAEVLGLDPVNDLALIKIEYDSIPMKLATKDDTLNIWQFVIAVWNALSEFQNSVSFWVVSWKDRIIEADWEVLSSLIQTDTAINPGNSWGPLIDMSGKVIGINTAIAWWQGLGFSISITSEKVAYMLDSIEKQGEIKKPFIWIYYIPINELIAEELWVEYEYGLYIPDSQDSIIEWSAADSAWLEKWDIILSVDWKNITFEFSLDILLQNKFPWEILELEILRDNQIQKLNLELGTI